MTLTLDGIHRWILQDKWFTDAKISEIQVHEFGSDLQTVARPHKSRARQEVHEGCCSGHEAPFVQLHDHRSAA